MKYMVRRNTNARVLENKKEGFNYLWSCQWQHNVVIIVVVAL